jgi:hypothetical protein
MINSSDTIGNRTRDLPACSTVSQTNAPPRTPNLLMYTPTFTSQACCPLCSDLFWWMRFAVKTELLIGRWLQSYRRNELPFIVRTKQCRKSYPKTSGPFSLIPELGSAARFARLLLYTCTEAEMAFRAGFEIMILTCRHFLARITVIHSNL